MKKTGFFLIVVLWAILCVASSSRAQTGTRVVEERVVTSSHEADSSVVKVYGPDGLTELAGQAIREERPGVVVETYSKPLKNKVYIEGTTGTGYMALSPARVNRLEKARDQGGSVYAALCSQQKGVIQKTVGKDSGWTRIERKKVRTTCYVRRVCPPPPVVFVPAVNVGYYVGGPYPVYAYGYGYRGYGVWGAPYYPYYRGGRGYHPGHGGHGPHQSSGRHH